MPSRCSSILQGISRICPYKDGYVRVIIVSCLLFIFPTGKTHLGLMLSMLLIVQFNKKQITLLYEQFVDCQTLSEEELPNGALADAIIKELEDEVGKTQNEYGMDVLWYHLQSMKNPIKGLKFCLKLPK